VGFAALAAVMLAAAGLAWACLPQQTGLPREPAPRSGMPSAAREAAVDQSLRFREDFGLRRDLAHVRGLVDGSVPADSYDYGVPLTAAENKEFEERSKVEDAMGIVFGYRDRSAVRSFGGVYIDQAHGGLVYVGFTEAPRAHMAALRKLFPYPNRLRLFRVRNTEAELDEVHTAVADARSDLAGEGVDIQGISTAVQSNVVEIQVRSDDQQTVAMLEKRFGSDKIRVVKSVGRITPT
jgi:hypothetical protein